MGLCQICPHKLKTLDADGNVVWTQKGEEMLKSTNGEYEKMPCSKCVLGQLAGMNYKKGRDIISLDAMEGENGVDFDEIDPIFEGEYRSNQSTYSNEDDFEEDEQLLLLPLDTIMHISAIMRTLPYKVRMLVEYKLTYPEETIAGAARILGLEASKAYGYINSAKRSNPILLYLLDSKERTAKDLLKQQQSADMARYEQIERYLSKYKQDDPEFYIYIKSLAHFFNLTAKEIKQYQRNYRS